MTEKHDPNRRPPMENWPAIFAAARAIGEEMGVLDFDSRITLLCTLLMQEICTLPPAERLPELYRLIDDLPAIFGATQHGMRLALVENGKKGL